MALDTGLAAILLLAGRVIFGGLLAFQGLNHFLNTKEMTGYAQAKGLPAPGVGVIASGVLLAVGGLAIILVVYATVAAGAVAVFLLSSAVIFHDFWAVPEEQARDEMVNFLEKRRTGGCGTCHPRDQRRGVGPHRRHRPLTTHSFTSSPLETPHHMTGPHQDQPLVTAGTPVAEADAALVAVHGRGATAQSIVDMTARLHREGLAVLAPQAARNTWYPHSFLDPVEKNEPGRSSGLEAVGNAVETATGADIPAENILVLGFSQGACLASEFVAQNPRRYGGAVAFSGGLIGRTVDPDDYEGDLEATPYFVGCSDVDPHIPVERVHSTTETFKRLNADVEERIYEGMGHGINEDELQYVDSMVTTLF